MNADEMGLTTVKNPGKIVAQKGVKQVGAVTSGQRVNLVTLSCAVNVFGNSIVPTFVFPDCSISNILLMLVHQDALVQATNQTG